MSTRDATRPAAAKEPSWAAVLARMPGVGAASAVGIVALRDDVGGFASVEELGMVAELPADVVDALRERTIFLPRS